MFTGATPEGRRGGTIPGIMAICDANGGRRPCNADGGERKGGELPRLSVGEAKGTERLPMGFGGGATLPVACDTMGSSGHTISSCLCSSTSSSLGAGIIALGPTTGGFLSNTLPICFRRHQRNAINVPKRKFTATIVTKPSGVCRKAENPPDSDSSPPSLSGPTFPGTGSVELGVRSVEEVDVPSGGPEPMFVSVVEPVDVEESVVVEESVAGDGGWVSPGARVGVGAGSTVGDGYGAAVIRVSDGRGEGGAVGANVSSPQGARRNGSAGCPHAARLNAHSDS